MQFKKRWIWEINLFFMVITFCLGAVAEEKKVKENLLADFNPGFEDEYDGMQCWNKHDAQVTLIDKEPKDDIHSGMRALKLESKDEQSASWVVDNSARIDITTAERLTVRFWAKGKGKTQAGFSEFKDENGKISRSPVYPDLKDNNLTDGWKEYEFNYEAGEKVFSVQLIFVVPPAKIYPKLYPADWFVIIDDVSIVRDAQ